MQYSYNHILDTWLQSILQATDTHRKHQTQGNQEDMLLCNSNKEKIDTFELRESENTKKGS